MNLNDVYKNFLTTFVTVFDSTFPKQVTKKQHENTPNKKHCPWMTNALIRCCRKKTRLLKIAKKHKSVVNSTKYRLYRNYLKKTLKFAEKNYYHAQLQTHCNDIRATWKVINSMLKGSQHVGKNIFLKKITDNTGKCIESPQDIAECFNEYFVNIGPNLAKQITGAVTAFTDTLPRSTLSSMQLNPVTTDEIASIIRELKLDASPGLDEIPSSVVKSVCFDIAEPLAAMINAAFHTGVFPKDLKCAKVIPVYKSGEKSSLGNYRPISILNTFSKVFEKAIVVRLSSFITKHNILYDNQFGFRKQHSTSLAILKLVDMATKAFDNNLHCDSVFIDLSKAFDTIDHNIMFKKLEHYGIRGIVLTLFKAILVNAPSV
jgi:hypothetical protein